MTEEETALDFMRIMVLNSTCFTSINYYNQGSSLSSRFRDAHATPILVQSGIYWH